MHTPKSTEGLERRSYLTVNAGVIHLPGVKPNDQDDAGWQGQDPEWRGEREQKPVAGIRPRRWGRSRFDVGPEPIRQERGRHAVTQRECRKCDG